MVRSSSLSRDEALLSAPVGAMCTVRTEACAGTAGPEGSRERLGRRLPGGAKGGVWMRREARGFMVPSPASCPFAPAGVAEVSLPGR